MVEDVARDHDREHQEHEDGREIDGVGLDRAFHFFGIPGTRRTLRPSALAVLRTMLQGRRRPAACAGRGSGSVGSGGSGATVVLVEPLVCWMAPPVGVLRLVMAGWVSQATFSTYGGRAPLGGSCGLHRGQRGQRLAEHARRQRVGEGAADAEDPDVGAVGIEHARLAGQTRQIVDAFDVDLAGREAVGGVEVRVGNGQVCPRAG